MVGVATGAGSTSPSADAADSFTMNVYSYRSILEGHVSSWDRTPGRLAPQRFFFFSISMYM